MKRDRVRAPRSGGSPGRVRAWIAAAALLAPWAGAAEPLRVNGSTTVNPVVASAAEALRAERGLEITVDTQGGSSGGISGLGEGRIEVGMSSRPVTEADRAKYPHVRFHPVHVGEDAVALVVSRDVWESGVRSLSKQQMRGIYEGHIRSWRELGGADRRIAFFNKEPGRGTWEVFARWLYGSPDQAPLVSHAEVGGNEETRNKVAGTPGALSQLSASWADGERVVALGIAPEKGDGAAVFPTAADIASRRYPISRPLFLLTDGPPRGDARELVEFVLSERGQELVRRHGYLALEQVLPGVASGR